MRVSPHALTALLAASCIVAASVLAVVMIPLAILIGALAVWLIAGLLLVGLCRAAACGDQQLPEQLSHRRACRPRDQRIAWVQPDRRPRRSRHVVAASRRAAS